VKKVVNNLITDLYNV